MLICTPLWPALSFTLHKTDDRSAARAGTIATDHGTIPTPIFMPVGTVGSVKAVSQQQLKSEVDPPVILGNTYHLYLRPGMDTMEAAGGLHRFMNWDRPVLTDSGGYQVFSLAANRKINEEGVLFRSHIDGAKHLFTPERVMDIERSIGADIMMAFDECPPAQSEYRYALDSMNRTHRWLDRCLARFGSTPDRYGHTQNLFPIVQGAVYHDLRKASCEYIASKGATGSAIGGLSVGEPEPVMYEIAALCCAHLPTDKPRYLMGVGTPWNILENIALGVDMFDCVMPTRNGRNAMLFTSKGVVNIDNKKWGARLFADRRRHRLRHLALLQQGLPAAPLQGRRVPGAHHRLHPQPGVLPVACARGAPAYPRGRLCQLEGGAGAATENAGSEVWNDNGMPSAYRPRRQALIPEFSGMPITVPAGVLSPLESSIERS